MRQWFTLDRNEWLVIIASYPVVIIINYRMLSQPAPTVEEVDGQFVVTLPLIKAG